MKRSLLLKNFAALFIVALFVPSVKAQEESDTLGELPENISTAPDVVSPQATEEAPLTKSEGDLPEDVKELEKRIEGARSLAPSLVEEDPGEKLETTEKFYRVPLRPRTSDANWRKWAGKQLSKYYKIHSGDTLWSVSERLFGNPYLWPKVWQLNAQLSNPHAINAGLELDFAPGNPNSAPELAFRSANGENSEELPMMVNQQEMGFLEKLEEVLQAQARKKDPPFKFFLFNTKPKFAGEVKAEPEYPRYLFAENSAFATKAEDGDYSIVRSVRTSGGAGYALQWVGKAKVQGKHGKVTQAFSEVQADDFLIARDFWLSPLALHEESAGEEKIKLFNVSEGTEMLTERRIFGANFKSVESGPRPGAIMQLQRGESKVGRVLLLDRNEKIGTFWVIDNQLEIDLATDKIL